MNLINFVSDVVALFLMWLFISASIHKLQGNNRQYYQQLFSDYGLSNETIALALRYLLGALEMILAFAILFEMTRSIAAVIAAMLLGAYLLGMAVQLIKGKRDMSCGCSGPNSEMKISGALLIRNACLVMLTLTCLIPGEGFSSNLWFAAIMTSGFMILSYSCVENLIANAQKIAILRAY